MPLRLLRQSSIAVLTSTVTAVAVSVASSGTAAAAPAAPAPATSRAASAAPRAATPPAPPAASATAGKAPAAGRAGAATARPSSTKPAAPAASPSTSATASPSAAAAALPAAGVRAGFDPAASTVIDAQTTPTRLVYANPDGSQTMRLSTRPVRFRDATGAWKDRDFTLVPGSAGALKARSGEPGAASLSGSPVGAFATLPTPAGPITLTHADAVGAAVPVLAGAAATFRGVLGGRDLHAQVTADGVEESVVLPGRGLLGSLPTPGSYTVALGLPAGVTARTGGPGVELVDGAGKVVATYGGGYAADSAVTGSGDGAQAPVTSTLLGQAGRTATVKVAVDAGWLTDAARVFPVTIDPGLYLNTSQESATDYDTYTYSTYPSTAEGTYDTNPQLKVGTFDGGATRARTFLKFNTTGLSGLVTDAHVDINNWYSYACSGSPALTLSGTAGAFSRAGTTWANQPGPDAAGPVSSTTFSYGYDSSCPGTFKSLDATSLAQRWAGGAANNGIVLATDETNSYGWKKFTNGAAGNNLAPALYITYNTNCTVYAGYSVCGAIRDKYNALGGPGGVLGNPTSNELQNADSGRRSVFQNGFIYWRADTGAHQIGGAIAQRWASQGYETSPLGYPVTDEYAGITSFNGTGDRQNDFEHGSIYWNHTANVTNGQVNPQLLVGSKPFFSYDTFKLTDRITAKVNRGTGNLDLSITELTAPGVAGDRTVGLNYASLATAPGSSLAGGTGTVGPGGWRTTDTADVRILVNAGARTADYIDSSGAVWRFTGTGPFTAPPGFDGNLIRNADNTFTVKVHGSGQTLSFDAGGQLTGDTDRNNNKVAYPAGPAFPTAITGTRGAGDGRTVHLNYTGPNGTLGQLCQSLTAASCTGSITRSDSTLLVDHAYGPAGNLGSITDPNGKATTFGYDTGNAYPGMQRNLTTVTDPNGIVTRFTYDTLHRVTGVTRDDNGTKATTTYDFITTDGHARVFGPEHPRGGGVFTDYGIDSRNRITDRTDAKGAHASTTWTGNNQVASSTNASGGVSKNSYTQPTNAPAGQNGPEALGASTGPGGSTSTATYTNPAGGSLYSPTTTTDSMKNQSTYSYDGAGNLGSSTNAMAATAAVGHNGDGTVSTATDPNNAATASTPASNTVYSYDAYHQLTRVAPPGGDNTLAARTFTYDGFGRTASSGTGRLVTTFSYDRDGRVTSQAHNDNTPAVTTSYDGAGNALTSSDQTGTVTNTWTAGNSLAKTVRTGTSPSTVSYTYDKTGKLTSLTDGRGTTRYHYDKVGNLDQMTESSGAIDLFAYNPDHKRTDSCYNTSGTNGTTATYDSTGNTLQPPAGFAAHTLSKLDYGGRLIRTITARASSTTIVADISYCYSPYVSGGVCAYPTSPTQTTTSDTDKRQWAFDSVTGARTTYTYDKANRLVAATVTGGPNPTTYAYCYDADGNRTYDSTSPVDCTQVGPGKTTTPKYTYNSVNQIISGGASYDTDGNQTGPAPLTAGSYNNADQTVSLTPAGQASLTASYTGDSQNSRLTLGDTSYTQGAGGVLSQTSSTGGTTYFERDPNGTLIATRTGTTEHWYYVDGLGSVLGLIDSSGTVQASYTYDPYGVTTTSGPNTTLADSNPYRYASGYHDNATGLYKYGKRYYQPTLGRWTQQDTLDIIGDPTQGNRYTYTGDDPVNNTDPSGQCSFSELLSCAEDVEAYAAPVVEVGVGATLIGLAGAACTTGVLCGASVAVGTIGAGAVAAGVDLGYHEYTG